jgi:hypothetical protein
VADRLSDRIAKTIDATVEDMDIPEVVKDQLEYEVVPFMAPDMQQRGSVNLHYMLGLGLPASTGDSVMLFHPIEDPHDEDEIGRLVRLVFADVQQQVSEIELGKAAGLNGHKKSAGGLLLP